MVYGIIWARGLWRVSISCVNSVVAYKTHFLAGILMKVQIVYNRRQRLVPAPARLKLLPTMPISQPSHIYLVPFPLTN